MSVTLSTRMGGGGITKRGGGGRVRVDRDGDLDMDAPATGRGGRSGTRARGGRSRVNINNAARGPPADKSGSGGIAARVSMPGPRRDPIGTRSRGIAQAGAMRRGGAPPARAGPSVEVRVMGWKQSKGSAEECVQFLERKTKLRFRKTQKQGETIVLYVPTKDLQAVLDWDKAKFAGVNLKITSDVMTDLFNATMSDARPENSDTPQTIKILEEVLRLRYNPETKFLDLSRLGNDPLLREQGFFELNSTTSKMFPALMAVADKKFDTALAKREAIQSVSLAHNELKSVSPVTTLSHTFPDIQNLSLEGNFLTDLKSLEPWRIRFRRLEQLILIGNPITELPSYRNEMIRSYPKLVKLDHIQVDRPQIMVQEQSKQRTLPVQNPSTATDASGRPILTLPTKGNLLVDDNNGTAMAFLSTFFTQIDLNKQAILTSFYTAESKFSLSVNTSAPRVEAQKGERQYWESYIPKSRNMKRLHDTQDIFNRLAQGPAEIEAVWNSLPKTRHNLSNQALWSFDIFPTELSPSVPAFLATVHSEFEELNDASGGVIKRSFDRSFTLSINGMGGVEVVADMLVVRSYGGATAWEVEPAGVADLQPPTAPAVAGPSVEEKQMKCQMLSEKSGLTLEFAELCLADTNWDLMAAWNAFQWAKDNGKLGPEAFAK